MKEGREVYLARFYCQSDVKGNRREDVHEVAVDNAFEVLRRVDCEVVARSDLSQLLQDVRSEFLNRKYILTNLKADDSFLR